jgi:hypothetical protein
MEYTWGPSEEFEKGNAWWAGIMDNWVHERETLGALERAAKKGDRTRIDELLHENPNIIAVPTAATASAFLKGDASAGTNGKDDELPYATVTATELGEAPENQQKAGALIPDKASNPEDYNMMAVLLGEATPWGMVGRRNEYSLEQSGKSLKDAGAASGPLISEDTAMKEMIFMVSAIINRMGASNSGNSIPKIAASGAFNGYEIGKGLLENGGAPERQMAFARAAID